MTDRKTDRQIDWWRVYTFNKRSDRRDSQQTGRQMYKLRKEKEMDKSICRHVESDRDSMPKAGNLCSHRDGKA